VTKMWLLCSFDVAQVTEGWSGAWKKRERSAAHVHDARAGDFEGAQGERAAAFFEPHFAEFEPVKFLYERLPHWSSPVMSGGSHAGATFPPSLLPLKVSSTVEPGSAQV